MITQRSLCSLIAATVLGIGFVFAAEPPLAGQGGFGRGGPRGRMADAVDVGMGPLNAEQRIAFEKQLDREKLRDLGEKMRVAQTELMSAALASPFDETVVRGKAETVAKLQIEITLQRSKALSSISATITSEQKQRLVESPAAGGILNGGGQSAAVIRIGGPMRGGFGRSPEDFSTGVDPLPRER